MGDINVKTTSDGHFINGVKYEKGFYKIDNRYYTVNHFGVTCSGIKPIGWDKLIKEFEKQKEIVEISVVPLKASSHINGNLFNTRNITIISFLIIIASVILLHINC